MKTNLIYLLSLIFLSFFSSFSANAQAPKFGKIDLTDLSMTTYAHDTSAAAVILSDYGSLEYVEDYYASFVYKRHVRIKVLGKAGLNYANVEIPYGNGEEIDDIKGVTYNLADGKISEDKLKQEDIYEEKYNRRTQLKKFAMPNVKVGSVIEYTYAIDSRYFQNLKSWNFQAEIPVVWSEFSVRIPKRFEFKLVKQGDQPLYTPEELGLPHNFRREGNRWIAKNVPALPVENYITTLSDYVTRIGFELYKINYSPTNTKVVSGNWQEFVDILEKDENFGVPLVPAKRFELTLGEIKEKYKTPAEQIIAIYDLVRNKVTWDEYTSWEVVKPLPEILNGGTGDVGDINLLLVAMLREAGFDANPVLISTRSYGKPYKRTPLHIKFNYVIAQVRSGDEELLLDATERRLEPGMLPERCLNGEGYLVNGADSKWISLKSSAAHSTYFVGNLTIDKSGKLHGTGEELLDGYTAFNIRNKVHKEGVSDYLKTYNTVSGNFKKSDATISNLDSLSKPVAVKYNIATHGNDEQQPNISVLYLSPDLGHGIKENPFKVPARSYPVDFPAQVKETVVCNYKLAAGWKVAEVPQSISLSLPDRGATFTYMVQQTGDMLQVVSRFNINKTIFAPEEYPQLRELYNQAIAKHAEKIVLKKESL